MVWRADGTFLFGDTLAHTIYAFDYDHSAGAIANRRVFAHTELPGMPDGSCLDADGYLWNARVGGSCLIRFAPDGAIDRVVTFPVTAPTSCAFGGPDLATLYVTSSSFGMTKDEIKANPNAGALLAIEAGIKGMPAARFAG